jgi:hypothetical protein
MFNKKGHGQPVKPIRQIDPSKIKIGDVILVASGTKVIIAVQEKYKYGESSKWTHVAGSIGGCDLVEGQIPWSRTCSLQKHYVDKGDEIRVLRKKDWENEAKDRVKVALWWATMNNTLYDIPQLFNYLIGLGHGKLWLSLRNRFNNHKTLICSELIVNGFFKEGYNLFNKPAGNVLPADYDNTDIFDIVEDVWV